MRRVVVAWCQQCGEAESGVELRKCCLRLVLAWCCVLERQDEAEAESWLLVVRSKATTTTQHSSLLPPSLALCAHTSALTFRESEVKVQMEQPRKSLTSKFQSK